MRSALLVALLLAGALALAGAASAAPPAGQATAVETATCTRTVVNGKVTCVRVGQRCVRRYQKDYLRAGLSCLKGRRLGAASPRQIRGPEPYVVSPNGQMSFATALAVFDRAVADLPGVAARPGEVGAVEDATGAIAVISANRQRLTPAQSGVFELMTTPAPDAVIIPADGSPAVPPATSALGDAPDQEFPGQSSCKPASTDELILAQQYLELARDALRGMGFPLSRAVRLCFLEVGVTSGGQPVAMYVTGDDLPPSQPLSPTCDMFVTRTGRAVTGAEKQKLFAHEYAHCLQHQYVDTIDQFGGWPEWVVEGSAEWLGAMAVQASGLGVEDVLWDGWQDHPQIDLFRRAYDAVGFWAMVHQATGQGQQRVRDVWAVAKGGSGPAFARAVAGVPEVFNDRWGAGGLRTPTYGPEWDYEGPGIDPFEAPEVTVAGGGPPKVLAVSARGAYAADLKIRADVVAVTVGTGARGLIRTFDATTAKLKTGAWCGRQGGCVCRTRAKLALPRLGALSAIGFNAKAGPAAVTLTGLRLADYCRNPRPRPAKKGPGGGAAKCLVPPAAPGGGPVAAALRPRTLQACPPLPGIVVYRPVEGSSPPPVVATIRELSCTAGGSFVGIGTDGEWRLEIGIDAFRGFGVKYDLKGGVPDPSFVVDGPLGTFSSDFPTPLAGAGTGAGGLGFGLGGRQLGFAYAPAWGPGGLGGGTLILAGGANCAYPEDD